MNLGFERGEVNYFILDSPSMQLFYGLGEPFGRQELDKAADFAVSGVARRGPAVGKQLREKTIVRRFVARHMATSRSGSLTELKIDTRMLRAARDQVKRVYRGRWVHRTLTAKLQILEQTEQIRQRLEQSDKKSVR